MKLVNTYISNDCTKKVLVYVDKNNHYTIQRYFMWEGAGWTKSPLKDRTFKHIESAQRAIKKWIS